LWTHHKTSQAVSAEIRVVRYLNWLSRVIAQSIPVASNDARAAQGAYLCFKELIHTRERKFWLPRHYGHAPFPLDWEAELST